MAHIFDGLWLAKMTMHPCVVCSLSKNGVSGQAAGRLQKEPSLIPMAPHWCYGQWHTANSSPIFLWRLSPSILFLVAAGNSRRSGAGELVASVRYLVFPGKSFAVGQVISLEAVACFADADSKVRRTSVSDRFRFAPDSKRSSLGDITYLFW